MTAVDYRSPCRMVWDLAGRPDPTDGPNGQGVCALCGEHDTLHATIGPNFTDYRRLANVDGTRLCVACSWALGGKPPKTLRMWTVVARLDQPAPVVQLGDKASAPVSGQHLLLTNRRDLRPVASCLAWPPAYGSPWLAAVAESGQKHCVPFATVNHGDQRWTVTLDGVDITSAPGEWRHVLAHTAALRAARAAPARGTQSGSPAFTAAAVESGTAPVAAFADAHLVALWQHHIDRLRPWLGTPLLHLANLMITKEHADEYHHTYPAD